MTSERRKLMLTVVDENPKVIRYVHLLDGYIQCDEILKWLIRNRLIGDKFVTWIQGEFYGVVLNMALSVLSRIKKEKKDKILYGVDFM